MIWRADSDESRYERAVRHVEHELVRTCGERLNLDPAALRELASSVVSVVGSDGASLSADSGALVVLASKALHSIGERDAARRLVVLGGGLVSPSVWEVTGQDTVWVLDLEKMSLQEGASLELVLFGILQAVIQAVADVWDESGGEGTLGLRNVNGTARVILGRRRGNKQALRRMAEEISGWCEARLERVAHDRGWQTVPRVMDMDLG
jgi:hypothetical protein